MTEKEKNVALIDKVNINGKNYHCTKTVGLIEQILQIRDGFRRGKLVNIVNNSLSCGKRTAKKFV